MVVYQLMVKGSSATFESSFKMYSKQVFQHVPTQDEKDAFVKRCADEKYIDYLDTSQEYEVKVLELELVE